MRIFIITMEDPVYTLPFIREIIDQRKQDIVGLAVAHGDRMTIGKNRSQDCILVFLAADHGHSRVYPVCNGHYCF
ncbi:MAG: hypothetical protein IPG90_07075 [Bacteroidetes bacterium]|nr:hypothetical protein [Bacteroidota bacterium]